MTYRIPLSTRRISATVCVLGSDTSFPTPAVLSDQVEELDDATQSNDRRHNRTKQAQQSLRCSKNGRNRPSKSLVG